MFYLGNVSSYVHLTRSGPSAWALGREGYQPFTIKTDRLMILKIVC
jgi:hypothetical protein